MSTGKHFYETMIQKREQAPIFFSSITKWLNENGVEYQISTFDEHSPTTLCRQFFKRGYYLSINTYAKEFDKQKPILLGKGVCFDTGGYNLKNAKCEIERMWYDKNGAVLALAAAIDLQAPCKVFIADNMPDILPGSIVTEPNTGTRIYIKDTDAEGRIGLADILSSVQNKHPKALTIATLTGAAAGFSGENILSLVHCHNKEIQKAVIDCGHPSLYPAPVHKEYDKAIHSKIKGADIDNLSTRLKGAGSQLAYSFLKHFFKGELMHVDMAAMSCTSDGNALEWGLEEIKCLYKILEEA